MTGPPGAVQAGGNWGLGTGDTPTWPGASNGAWPAGRKTEETGKQVRVWSHLDPTPNPKATSHLRAEAVQRQDHWAPVM